MSEVGGAARDREETTTESLHATVANDSLCPPDTSGDFFFHDIRTQEQAKGGRPHHRLPAMAKRKAGDMQSAVHGQPGLLRVQGSNVLLDTLSLFQGLRFHLPVSWLRQHMSAHQVEELRGAHQVEALRGDSEHAEEIFTLSWDDLLPLRSVWEGMSVAEFGEFYKRYATPEDASALPSPRTSWTQLTPGDPSVLCHPHLIPRELAAARAGVQDQYQGEAEALKFTRRPTDEDFERYRLHQQELLNKYIPRTVELDRQMARVLRGSKLGAVFDVPEVDEKTARKQLGNCVRGRELPFHTHDAWSLVVYLTSEGEPLTDTLSQTCFVASSDSSNLESLTRASGLKCRSLGPGLLDAPVFGNQTEFEHRVWSHVPLRVCPYTAPGRAALFAPGVYHGVADFGGLSSCLKDGRHTRYVTAMFPKPGVTLERINECLVQTCDVQDVIETGGAP